MNEEKSKVYTVKEVQDILKLSRTAAYKLINSQQFPIIRIGRSVRIPSSEFTQWMQMQYS